MVSQSKKVGRWRKKLLNHGLLSDIKIILFRLNYGLNIRRIDIHIFNIIGLKFARPIS